MKKLLFFSVLFPFSIYSQITINGNGNSGFGSPVGNGSLQISSSGSNITFTITRGTGNFNDFLVIYISNGAVGRRAIDGDLSDNNDAHRRAISLRGGAGVTFSGGFRATHAIAMNAGSGSFCGLWSIPATGTVGNGDLGYITGVSGPTSNTFTNFSFTITYSNIGLSSGDPFDVVCVYGNPNDGSEMFLSNEMIGTSFSGSNPGKSMITLSNYRRFPTNEVGGQASTAAAGNWNSATTWSNGNVPLSRDEITIGHNVSLNQNATISSLTINSGATFTASDASPRTLTIRRDQSGSGTTLSNSGTWSNGTGGSTVIFTGSTSGSDAIHAVSGSIEFNNVIINKISGTPNVGVNFGTGGKLATNGKLTIEAGGYVSSIPSDFYTANTNTTLQFNTTGGYTVNTGDVTWPATNPPSNIQISTNTVTLNATRSLTGNLTLDGGNLTINATRALTVNGTLSNNNSITLEATSKTDYARLIYGAVSGTGTVNHQMRLVPGTSYKWYAIGSPVDGININSIGTGQFTASSVYNWSATGGWSSAHTGTFTRGQGVFIAAGENSPYGFFTIPADNSNIVFSGSLSSNTSAVVRSLDYGSAPSGVTFSASPGVTQGWNLLANPYHADFDLNGLDADNESTEKSLSIRTPTGYTSYNPTTNTPSSARYLSPGEAFFVRANTTGLNFTFALSRRSASGGDGLLKTQNNFDRINIRVSKNDRTDEMYVLFKSDATTGFDGKYDAYKFNRIEGYPMIYSVIGNVYYSINTLPSLSGSYSLPTRFTCTEAGAYTISLFDVSDFDPSIVVTLEDKLTNTFTMLNNGDYTFTHNPSNNPDRFVLHFNKSTVSTIEHEVDKLNAWVHDGQVYLKGYENMGRTTLKVTDMTGKVIKIWNTDVVAGATSTFALPNLAKGVYVLSIEAGGNYKNMKFVY